MRFGLIDPYAKKVGLVDVISLDDAYQAVGLKKGSVDHAVIGPGLAIVVHEDSLMAPPDEQAYFALTTDPQATRQLYGGCAVIYAFDDHGESTDVPAASPLHITWINSPDQVEDAITAGFISRPAIRVHDAVIWEWEANPPARDKMN